MKQALAVMTSHYAGLDLQRVSEGFVDMPDRDLEKLVDAAEAPSAALAARFEGEVVPLLSTCEEAWTSVRDKRPCNRLVFVAGQACGPLRPL
jgi:hypothetical protein